MNEIVNLKRKCPICDGYKGKILYTIKELLAKNIILPNVVNVVECDNCGFCYADTTATAKMYDDYYSKSNIYAGRSVKKVPNADKILIKKVLEFVDKRESILDMGCGNGNWLLKLKGLGYQDLYGIDMSQNTVDNIRSFGIKSSLGGAYDIPSKQLEGKFDVIFFNCVFEHLLYPRKAIENIKLYLKNGGRVILTVPDIKKVEHGDTGPSHHFHHEHINYFSTKSMNNLMQSVGFHKIESYSIIEDSDSEAVFGAIYRFKGDINCKFKRVHDAPCITKYIEKYTKKNSILHNRIVQLSKRNKPVLLYGMGARMLQTLADISSNYKLNVFACVDGNAARVGEQLEIFNKVFLIQSWDNIDVPTEVAVIVCVNSKQYQEEIIEKIKMSGWGGEIITF